MTEIQKAIQEALRQQRVIRHRRAWLAGAGVFVLVMAAAALADRIWMFQGVLRWVGWVVGLALAAWAARFAAGRAAADALTLAHRTERAAGETAAVVATSIDPAVRRTAEGEPVAMALLERVDRRAAKALQAAPPSFDGHLRKPASVTICALVALIALLGFGGGKGLTRMLLPWFASPYTSIVLRGPAAAPPEGKPFTLTAEISGLPVGKVSLHRVGVPKPVAEASPDENGRVSLSVDGLEGPAEFYLRGGDGSSAMIPVEPYPLPRIESFEITVAPPAYATGEARVEKSPSFAVFRGSTLRYRIHLHAPAASVQFQRNAVADEEEWATPEERAKTYKGYPTGRIAPAAAEPPVTGPVFRQDPENPLVWEAEWPLPEADDVVYRLAVTGERGDLVRNDEPWRIDVLWDAAPVVQIRSHDGGEVIKLGNETVRFELGAVDDVRLAKVRLVFRQPGQPHAQREIQLPPDTLRAWSGKELLDLAPFNLKPLDIVAVHAEAEDANMIDGPGIGRSEVVFLEVPMPPAPPSSEGGEGGGKSGEGSPPINPLALQMEILKSTMKLDPRALGDEPQSLAHDQLQNLTYTTTMSEAAQASGYSELAVSLQKAAAAMETAAKTLETRVPTDAIPDEEKALGFLIEAAQHLEESAGDSQKEGEASMEAGGTRYQLRPPPPAQSSPSNAPKEDKEEGEGEKIHKLVEEVKRQLAEQEKLNEKTGKPDDLAKEQEALSAAARAAAEMAKASESPEGQPGSAESTADELERAAGLQEETADALAKGDKDAGKRLGAESSKALADALEQLSIQIEGTAVRSEAQPPGYKKLVGDYLRSISYE